jgi:hypothetical protein
MRCFLLFLLIIVTVKCHAQEDTLSSTERNALDTALKNTLLGYNLLADMYSKKNDTVHASEYLLKSDPYYLIWLGQTPQSLPEFLSKFKASPQTKEQYLSIFTKAFNSPKSKYYTDFDRMYEEDQAIRKQLDGCSEINVCKKLTLQMHSTDSIHFTYLYNYVKKIGWPSIENGGLYADILAVHDHTHHSFYIPYLKESIKKGQSTLDVLDILYYCQREGSKWEKFKAILDTSKKFVFDVSDLLYFKLPPAALLSKIKKAIKDYCPVQYYLLFYSYKQEIQDGWLLRAHIREQKGEEHILAQFFDELHEYCTKYPRNMKGTWAVYHGETDTKRTKIVLYIVYK